MGVVDVPVDKYYGAQSARSLIHFDIGDGVTPRDVMPKQVVRAMAILKKAAALVNNDLGKLDKDKKELIVAAADEIIAGKLDAHLTKSSPIARSNSQAARWVPRSPCIPTTT